MTVAARIGEKKGGEIGRCRRPRVGDGQHHTPLLIKMYPVAACAVLPSLLWLVVSSFVSFAVKFFLYVFLYARPASGAGCAL